MNGSNDDENFALNTFRSFFSFIEQKAFLQTTLFKVFYQRSLFSNNDWFFVYYKLINNIVFFSGRHQLSRLLDVGINFVMVCRDD